MSVTWTAIVDSDRDSSNKYVGVYSLKEGYVIDNMEFNGFPNSTIDIFMIDEDGNRVHIHKALLSICNSSTKLQFSTTMYGEMDFILESNAKFSTKLVGWYMEYEDDPDLDSIDEEIRLALEAKNKKKNDRTGGCECGSWAVRHARHSEWCPNYEDIR